MSFYWQSHSHIHTTRRQENNTIIAVVSFPKSCNCLTVVHSNHSTISPMRDNLRGHYLLTDCLLGPAGNGGVKQRLHSAPVPGLKQTQQVKKWEYSNNKFQARTAARTPPSHRARGELVLAWTGIEMSARDGWHVKQINTVGFVAISFNANSANVIKIYSLWHWAGDWWRCHHCTGLPGSPTLFRVKCHNWEYKCTTSIFRQKIIFVDCLFCLVYSTVRGILSHD